MAGLQFLFARRHQGAEAIFSDGIVHHGNAIFFEVRRNVHLFSSARALSAVRRV
jgi:hypothetical protein